ncbi:hypothetical protein N1851_033806 [Merluccius polli]|uniref:Uncharacterized protein n=1 Tax=Merluccius polli TaxID=89951 RepID=A0AA47M0R1_MERPO|nr:hypothetical protein N1851_033806 [Merluccius polli]
MSNQIRLLVQDLIVENKIDILGLRETWLKPDVDLPLNEATPPNYFIAHLAHNHFSWMSSLISQLILLHILTKFCLLGILTFIYVCFSNSLFSSLPTMTPGVDISDLVVSAYTSALSDHFLLTFQVLVFCPRNDCQATYSCHRITPATTAAMADKLPLSLAPLSLMTSTLPYLQRSTQLLLLFLKSKLQKDQHHGSIQTLAPSNEAAEN